MQGSLPPLDFAAGEIDSPASRENFGAERECGGVARCANFVGKM